MDTALSVKPTDIEVTPIKSRDDALRFLQQHMPVLREMGVESLGVFGSFARDEVTDDSDLDLLVSFSRPITSKRYFGTLFYVEDRIGRKVDLATTDMLRPFIIPSVQRDLVHVN